MRAGLVPVFVDVEPDTFNVDAKAIEAEIGPQTRAILIPNLAGNAPDWDVIREVADRHGLTVIEDSCDALGATLRGTPTAARADITVTSFSPSHIVTGGGSGGMVCLDDDALWDRCVTLRGWGRRSEVQIYGSKGDDHNFWTDVDGMHYDNMFIFDEFGWNFLPVRDLRGLPRCAAAQAADESRPSPAQFRALFIRSSPRAAATSCRRARPTGWKRRGSATASRCGRTPGSHAQICKRACLCGASTPAPSGRVMRPASR